MNRGLRLHGFKSDADNAQMAAAPQRQLQNIRQDLQDQQDRCGCAVRASANAKVISGGILKFEQQKRITLLYEAPGAGFFELVAMLLRRHTQLGAAVCKVTTRERRDQ